MDNEISKKNNIVPPTTQQTGEKNLNITNNNGGVVNITYSGGNVLPLIPNPAATLKAIQNFSREYYHLIVTCDEIYESNYLVMSVDRSLRKNYLTDEIYQEYSSLSKTAIDELKNFPAIICNENTLYHGDTDPTQFAIYAYIEKIKVLDKNIKIYYVPIDVFPQSILNKYAIDFGLNVSCALTTLNHTHWTIKNIDLFEAFIDSGLNLRSPI